MKKQSYISGTALAVCTLLVILTIGSPDPVSRDIVKDVETVSFLLSSEETIIDAYGLLLHEPTVRTRAPAKSADHIIQAIIRPVAINKKAEIKRIEHGSWAIIIPLSPEDFQPGTKITYVARTRSGRVLPGELRWLVNKGEEIQEATCKKHKSDSKNTLLSMKEFKLQMLVDIRQAKVELFESQLAEALSPKAIDKLHQLEAELSIPHEKPISAKMPIPELLSRIGAIQARINK